MPFDLPIPFYSRPTSYTLGAVGSIGHVASTEAPRQFTEFARHYEDRIAAPDEWTHNVPPEFSCHAPKYAPKCPRNMAPFLGIHCTTSQVFESENEKSRNVLDASG